MRLVPTVSCSSYLSLIVPILCHIRSCLPVHVTSWDHALACRLLRDNEQIEHALKLGLALPRLCSLHALES